MYTNYEFSLVKIYKRLFIAFFLITFTFDILLGLVFNSLHSVTSLNKENDQI